ncbi:hypothetical protein A4A49_60011, partial [Nicotiana attenuata]
PIFICWELWKNRCAIRYGHKRTSVSRIRHDVLFHLKIFIKKNGVAVDMNWTWHQLYSIWWGWPPDGWIKINTDGSSNRTMKTTGIGGVVRNRNGERIMAFSKALQFCINNQSEVQAALHALQWCKNNNIHNVILEMDSLMVVNIIK